MSFETGLITDLSDSNSIADPEVLAMAAAIQLPFNLGTFWNDCMIDRLRTSNRKFDIFSRSETQRSGTIGTGGWTDGTTTTSLPVTSSAGLVTGLVIQVEDEVVVVASVPSTTTINVMARGAAGTTGAAHTATTAYTIIGSAIKDEDLKNVDSVSEITNKYENYQQTVAEAIDYTRATELDPRLGLRDQMMKTLEEEAFLRVARNIIAASVSGKKQASTSSVTPWMTAGLLQQLSDTTGGRVVLTDAVSGAFTEAALKSALRTVTDRGTPTDIYMSSANKDLVNAFIGSSPATTMRMNTELANTTAGFFVDGYNYEGLRLNVKIDSQMPDDQVAIVNMRKCKKGWKLGDELRLEKQPDQSSREHRAAYNGSFMIAVEDVGYEHILMTGLTT